MSRSTKTWTSTDIEATRTRLLGELAERFKPDAAAERLAYVMDCISAGPPSPHGNFLLSQFVYLVAALEIDVAHHLLPGPDVNRMFTTATSLLQAAGIERTSSRLNYLASDLHRLRSAYEARDGKAFRAAWQVELAKAHAYRPTPQLIATTAAAAAVRYLRLGHASLAITNFALAEQSYEGDEAAVNAARIGRIQALRLSGALSDASTLLAIAKEASPHDQRLVRETIALDVQQQHEPQRWLPYLKRDFEVLEPILTAKLWLFAARDRTLVQRVAKTPSLRRRFTSPAALTDARALMDALNALESAYDATIDLKLRLEDLGEALDKRAKLPTVEHELLFVAAALRWAHRFSQDTVLALLISEFECLNLRLSRGSHRDVLDLFAGQLDYSGMSLSEGAAKPATGVFESSLARRWAVTKLVGQSAGIMMTGRVRRALAATEERDRLKDEEMQQLGEAAFETFGRLKGGFMKVGQQMGLLNLTEPAFYEPLRELCDRAAPTNPEVAVKVIEAELGKPIDQIFAKWNPIPVAVGSIGQVFWGQLHDGREVAVKVRHPGIVEALKSDLSTMTFFAPFYRRLIPKGDVKALIDECRVRLMAEADYEAEANNQERSRKAAADWPEVVVPEVYREYSTASVLCMEFVRGDRFQDFIERSSPEERSRAGVIIARFTYWQFAELGLFNGDPNAGNFLFLPDGRVAFIDYGCMPEFSPALVSGIIDAHFAASNGDKDRLRQVLLDIGYVKNKNFNLEPLFDHIYATMAPFRAKGPFKITKDFLAPLLDVSQIAGPLLAELTPPRESVILTRGAALVNILALLGAEADWLQLADNYFKQRAVKRAG